MNRGVANLRGREGAWKVVSHGWKEDLEDVWRHVDSRVGTPMARDCGWAHPGLLGMNSDASRPRGLEDRAHGVGGNAMHAYFYAEWSVAETDALDSSTLELIGVAFLVAVAAIAGVARPRMVIRCDNESACRVINEHGATSPAMAAALLVLQGVQRQYWIEILAHHIASDGNVIADDLSRGRIKKAVDELRRPTEQSPVHVMLPDELRDLTSVIRAAGGR